MTPIPVAVALGWAYPDPSLVERLRAAAAEVGGPVGAHVEAFAEAVARLDLGQWEELHTATFDLNPQVVPYVGHLTWGDSYRRGELMADLRRAMLDAGVDPGGELPDHIEPILRYLAATPEPLADLVALLPAAVRAMARALAEAAPASPYRHLLAATLAVAEDLHPVSIRGRDPNHPSSSAYGPIWRQPR